MTTVLWRPVQTKLCERVGEVATLEVQLVFPGELLPDQPPRVRSRRCSLALQCNQLDLATCIWAGTQPEYDPLGQS
ncbi:MAG: hypothetical protein ABSG98_08600 [Anaerolineales bacterium]|jgi:hypothetical protein